MLTGEAKREYVAYPANANNFIVTMLAFSLKQHCVYVQPCRPVSIAYKLHCTKLSCIIFFNDYEEFCMHVYIHCVYCAESDGKDGINTPMLTASLLILILLLLKPVILFKNTLY